MRDKRKSVIKDSMQSAWISRAIYQVGQKRQFEKHPALFLSFGFTQWCTLTQNDWNRNLLVTSIYFFEVMLNNTSIHLQILNIHLLASTSKVMFPPSPCDAEAVTKENKITCSRNKKKQQILLRIKRGNQSG